MNNQELEVKFYIDDLEAIEDRIKELNAHLTQQRTHELNLRFDTQDGKLSRSSRVLRLRQDTQSRLTYKGPGYEQDGVRVREEIEFIVSDFSSARQLLQVLGYQVAMIYEKYRTVYDYRDAHITLDEMPYGDFVEIEGSDAFMIHSLSQQLGLNWDARIPLSYTELFARLRVHQKIGFRDLIFENFVGLDISPGDLGIIFADE